MADEKILAKITNEGTIAPGNKVSCRFNIFMTNKHIFGVRIVDYRASAAFGLGGLAGAYVAKKITKRPSRKTDMSLIELEKFVKKDKRSHVINYSDICDVNRGLSLGAKAITFKVNGAKYKYMFKKKDFEKFKEIFNKYSKVKIEF